MIYRTLVVLAQGCGTKSSLVCCSDLLAITNTPSEYDSIPGQRQKASARNWVKFGPALPVGIGRSLFALGCLAFLVHRHLSNGFHLHHSCNNYSLFLYRLFCWPVASRDCQYIYFDGYIATASKVKHLYNGGPTSRTLGRRCINVIQMFCVYWVTTFSNFNKIIHIYFSCSPKYNVFWQWNSIALYQHLQAF